MQFRGIYFLWKSTRVCGMWVGCFTRPFLYMFAINNLSSCFYNCHFNERSANFFPLQSTWATLYSTVRVEIANHDGVTFSRRTTGNRGKKERRRRKRTGKLAWKIPLLGEKRDTHIHINRREYRSTCHGEHDPFFRRGNALRDYIR